jgi:hypothetical protein
MEYQQLLITRYNVKFGGEQGIDPFAPGWLEHRDALFRRYCFASVRGQRFRGFEWFVIFHPETPRKYYDFLGRTATPVFGRTTSEAVEVIQRRHIRADTVVTSRIDNDDAIAPEFMGRVRQTFERALRVRFADGRDFAISFRNGIVAHAPTQTWTTRSQASPPFLTLVKHLAAGDTWLSPLRVDHNEIPKLYPVISLDNPKPLWAFVVHERNISNHALWPPSTRAEGELRSFPRRFPRYGNSRLHRFLRLGRRTPDAV